MVERRFYLIRRIKISPYSYAELYYRYGRYYIYFRDRLTGRFIKRQPFYRLSVICDTIVIHGKYYHAIFQTWVSQYMYDNYKEEIFEFGEQELTSFIEDMVGYPKEEWWFSSEYDYEEIEIPPDYYDALELFEYLFWYELRWENEYGMTVVRLRYPLPNELNPSRW